MDDVSFDIAEREIVGLVGESGSGKTATALSILRLIPPPGKLEKGEIIFEGVDLTKLSDQEMTKMRGARIAMIFQDPSSSLNPVLNAGYHISEAIRVHEKLGKKEAWDRSVELLNLVQIPWASKRVRNYPHELSGGMKQRVMIAMGLSCQPNLLIADEPTTGLDVTVQAQILKLIGELRVKGFSVLIITHDLAIVAQLCDRIAIMYAAKIVEMGKVEDIFFRPRHPYTIGLLRSTPSPRARIEELASIPGLVPNMINVPTGCRFHPRCSFASEKCHFIEPPIEEKMNDHLVACHFDEEVARAYNTTQ